MRLGRHPKEGKETQEKTQESEMISIGHSEVPKNTKLKTIKCTSFYCFGKHVWGFCLCVGVGLVLYPIWPHNDSPISVFQMLDSNVSLYVWWLIFNFVEPRSITKIIQLSLKMYVVET